MIIFIGVFQLNDKTHDNSNRLPDDFMELESFDGDTMSSRYSNTSRRTSVSNKKNNAVDIAYFQPVSESEDDFE